jgi:putative transposase
MREGDVGMGKHRSEEEILEVMRELEAGAHGAEICNRLGISRGCLQLWKKKYAGLQSSELRQLRELREENLKLRNLVANLSLERQTLKEMLTKKF